MDPEDRDDQDEPESGHAYPEPPRSVFSALWFRVILVAIVLGVIAAVAVPYVLEWMNPVPAKTAAVTAAPPATKPRAPAPPPPVTPPPAVAPAPAPAPAPPPVALQPAVTPAPARVVAKEERVVAKEEKEEKTAKPARRPAKAPATRAAARRPAQAGAGAYFVQVGAFKDAERASRVAAALRELKFRVDESTGGPAQEGDGPPAAPPAAPAPAGPAGDRYDVFVSGAPAADISAKLTAKGLATERSAGGVVVRPSLPLRDAVALSKDLAGEGLKVQVRRAGAGAPAAAPPAATAAGGESLHRVRVGPFADLAAARAARAALEAKGYKGFIVRGGE